MTNKDCYDRYDAFARTYNDHWGPGYGREALPILQAVLGEKLKKDIVILDLCCGSGHVSQCLIDNGHQVIGIDGSEQLLNYAKRNAPSAAFHRADARSFSLRTKCHGAICLNDSLNHILCREDLRSVFSRVFRALRYGGWFLFDLNLEHKYKHWKWSHSIVQDDAACVIEADADLSTKSAFFRTVVFERRDKNTWVRQDSDLTQTWYSVNEVSELLGFAGFESVECMTKDGRKLSSEEVDKAYFLCTKPWNQISDAGDAGQRT
jgi:SAM-dependent methyltransferase